MRNSTLTCIAVEILRHIRLSNLFTMVLHNPNNWHWVNKDAGPWAKDYLDTQVKQVSAEEDGVTAKITKLKSMDGDVEVSQRKGKVITIFDVSLQLEYEGTGTQST